ncbi:MAG: SDR family oxidoreductase [Bacteroidota bacterium]|nr:SDR family oxidoreductase [Bacteroidota bacterium]
MRKISGKVPLVWVTGSSKGIGEAIARAFAAMGTRVVLSGRDRKKLTEVCRSIVKSLGRAEVVLCDIASGKSVERAYASIVKKFGAVDVLVNNAGVTYFTSFDKTSVKQFDHVVNTNLRGTFLCTKAVLPSMLKRHKGWIFTINSVAAITTFVDSSAYAASKAGALAMTRGLRAEVRKRGVKVVDILPGAVETGMWSPNERKKFREKMMKPDDVASVVVSIYCQPERALTEEIVLRPVEGDL